MALAMIDNFLEYLELITLIIDLCIHVLSDKVSLILFSRAICKFDFIFSSIKIRGRVSATNRITIKSPGTFYHASPSFIIGTNAKD